MESLYIGCKIIAAEPMDEKSFFEGRGGEWVEGRPTREGYKVRYSDGYISWSPKAAFEKAYRKLDFQEAEMVGSGLISKE